MVAKQYEHYRTTKSLRINEASDLGTKTMTPTLKNQVGDRKAEFNRNKTT